MSIQTACLLHMKLSKIEKKYDGYLLEPGVEYGLQLIRERSIQLP